MGHTDAGPFDPPIGRQSSVVVLSRRFNDAWGDYRIVTTISTRSSTNVLEVNSSTGNLLFAADHSFTDEASALAALTRQSYMEIARGTTLLGFTATDTLAGLLLATKVTTKATLPGGHAVNLVADARWELLPLDASSSATNNPVAAAEEQEFWKSMQQHTVGGVHYYCETADLTRPFPSAYPPSEPELEFIWNAWLSQPLRDLGLPNHCPRLMQGAVEAVDEVHQPTGQRYTLCLLSRRSRRHPGTRYIARGLNEMAGPGNEIEAELIMWTPSAGSGNKISSKSAVVRWARVTWRRGTVPIWWGVELQPLNKGLQAEVYVKEDGPYVGMLSYVRTLQKLSTTDALGGAGGGSSGAAFSASAPEIVGDTGTDDVAKVTFINLLHCNPKKAAELMLSSHFEEGMAHVKARLTAEKAPCPKPSLTKFDWHGIMATLNEERGIEAFWTFIEHPVKNAGLAVGIMEQRQHNTGSTSGSTNSNSEEKEKVEKAEDITRWGDQWQMRWLQRQRGLLRFNCADSLDRTNAATCFAMLPVVQEGLRLLGIQLETSGSSGGGSGGADTAMLESPLRAGAAALAPSSTTTSRSLLQGDEQGQEKKSEQQGGGDGEMVLPVGWERREHAGRALYVDHVNRVTQWDPPQGTLIAPPWTFFKYKLEDVRSKLYADAVADYVTMFRKHGDVHSALYTGSPAMHSHVLGLVLAADARPYGASSSSVGKLQNLRVAVQRRWNNSVSDTARQQSMELFLGLNLAKYFPRVTSVVPPHHSGVQSDLHGIDLDDTLQAEAGLGVAHTGAELEKLHLRKHDGRVGLQEEITNLEPLEPPPPPPQPTLPPGGAPSGLDSDSLPMADLMSSICALKDDDDVYNGTEALDPLGAVRSPIRALSRQDGDDDGSGGSQGVGDIKTVPQFSLI